MRAQPAPWTTTSNSTARSARRHFSIRRFAMSRYRYIKRNTRNGMTDRLFVVFSVVDKHKPCVSRGGWLRARLPARTTVPLRGKRKEVIKKRRCTRRGLSRASSRPPTATTADGDFNGGDVRRDVDRDGDATHRTARHRIASYASHGDAVRQRPSTRRRLATSPYAVRGSDHLAIHVNIDYSRENGAPAIRALRGSLPRDNKGTLITLTARVDGRAGRGRR